MRVLIQVEKGFSLLAILDVINDNTVRWECQRKRCKYQRQFITVYARCSRNRCRLLDPSLSTRCPWTSQTCYSCMRARTVTLILAPCVLAMRAVNYRAARARELASVHGNKSMCIATARRYARNLSDSLKFNRDVSLPSTIFSEQRDSSINQPAIYFPRKGKKIGNAKFISRRRECRVVKFNAPLNKARCIFFLDWTEDLICVFYPRTILKLQRVIFLANRFNDVKAGELFDSRATIPLASRSIGDDILSDGQPTTADYRIFEKRVPKMGSMRARDPLLSLWRPISLSPPFSAIPCGSWVRSPPVAHRPLLATSYSPPIRSRTFHERRGFPYCRPKNCTTRI